MWSKEELDEGERILVTPVSPPNGSDIRRETVRALMTRAVELVAARGGTMTAAELDTQLMDASARYPGAGITLREHIAAQGGRNAVLEAEVAQLRASADELQRQRDSRGEALEVLGAERDALKAELASLKANPPAPSESSGQIAEDERAARAVMEAGDGALSGDEYGLGFSALSRLAAGAQRTRLLEAERDAFRSDLLAARETCRTWQEHSARREAELDDARREVDTIRKRSLEASNLEKMQSEKGLPAMLRYVVDGKQCSHDLCDSTCTKYGPQCAKQEVMCGGCHSSLLPGEEMGYGYHSKCKPPRHAPGEPLCVDGLTITAANRGAPGDVLVSPCIEGEDDQPLPEGPLEIVYPCSPSCTRACAATLGHPERLKERSEAFRVDSGTHSRFEEGYEDGAEAMRAACWEAVAARLETEGYDRGGALLLGLKAAIEGAAP